MRAKPLLNLLNSVKKQTLYPTEILIVDASFNNETKTILGENAFENLKYFKVEAQDRGLTKQRNFGVRIANKSTKVICFLDDDTILNPDYFENLISTYKTQKDAIAVGGYILNDATWEKETKTNLCGKFYFDGWMRKEPFRFIMRKTFGLLPDAPPGFLPTFAHGRSIGFLPPSGKIYNVEQIMGGVASYRKEIFETLNFSTYFEGYGLYEDADFSLRIAKRGKLYINTAAQLYHYHNNSGRPNKYDYGKMVTRNSWYVWRIKYPKPSIKARLKWNATAFLLTIIRFTNTATTLQKKEAFTESLGRLVGWWSLIFNKPKVER